MIIIRLKGGLGNQMFQYAFASILAQKKEVALKIDSQFFEISNKVEGITKRDFELSVFNNKYQEVSTKELRAFNKLSFLDKLKRKLGLNYSKKYNENSVLFQEDDYKLNTPVYLNGYFQSYKYYLGYENFVKDLFNFSVDSLDDQNKSLLVNINQGNTISIHVRRGDYVSVPSIKNVHGLCDFEYYMSAINLMTSQVVGATLIFFSDDSEWVKKTFTHLPHNKIISDYNKGVNSWKDMFLMSKCTHNIIANSSFSWWAAWLNLNPDKKVIAPKKWFTDTNRNTNDLIPLEWIQL